jgi:membrane-associated protease RseP (regulator of RpoE activity)
MPRLLALLLLASLLLITGCRSTRGQFHVGSSDYVLAKRTDDGRTKTWRLQGGTVTSLIETVEYVEERPGLGLSLFELDKERAEKRGVRPFTGLLVDRVAEDSTGAEAGVLAGDVLLAIDGAETFYQAQVKAKVKALVAGNKVTLQVLRGQDKMDLAATVRTQKNPVLHESAIDLETPASLPRPFAGVNLLGIPAAKCEEIFGAPRQAVIVTQVEVGSPAWVAGIRPGDVIDTLDGQPVPDVHTLQRTIATRGEAGESIQLGVHRGADAGHQGAVALADYQDDSNFYVPLVFCYQNGVWKDSWSIGPWGLLVRNRNTYVSDPTTRRVETTNVFSAVLGLLRIESRPDETRVRLLWFIRFDT